MDKFEIITEIYETRDRAIAEGMPFQNALHFAQHEISEKYHISGMIVQKLSRN
ncbi:MAG: hypothetical protein SCH39_07770 [Methanosarcinales archaeon]|nr:hypothetical protein [ANME-2 cluster archaeon]MDW7776212.1 hypothetical protein [Methanosarcinales archaeon]